MGFEGNQGVQTQPQMYPFLLYQKKKKKKLIIYSEPNKSVSCAKDPREPIPDSLLPSLTPQRSHGYD